MNFQAYLESTKATATQEKAILDELQPFFESKNATAIHYRAAERSLQILSENLIGKLKKILQYFGSPVIPNSAGDVLDLLVNVQAISEEKSRFFRKIIGLMLSSMTIWTWNEKSFLPLLLTGIMMNL